MVETLHCNVSTIDPEKSMISPRERELNAIRAYILENPANWDKDRENESGLFM